VAAGTYSYTAKAYDSSDPSLVALSPAVVVTVSPSVNVAAGVNGGVATASSFYNSSYPPSGAIDGDRKGLNWGSGGAWNDATVDAFPDWLQVNFSSVRSIGEIDVFMLQDGFATQDPTLTMTFTQYGVTAFQVQYWSGSAWVNVPGGNVTGNDRVWRQFSFTPISTDRIRVLVNNTLASFSRLVEVEAWTAAAPPQVDYQISGTATAGGAPLAGVAFATTNDGTCTPSDEAGHYTCRCPGGCKHIPTCRSRGAQLTRPRRCLDMGDQVRLLPRRQGRNGELTLKPDRLQYTADLARLRMKALQPDQKALRILQRVRGMDSRGPLDERGCKALKGEAAVFWNGDEPVQFPPAHGLHVP